MSTSATDFNIKYVWPHSYSEFIYSLDIQKSIKTESAVCCCKDNYSKHRICTSITLIGVNRG